MLTPNLLLPIKCKKPIDIISDPADLAMVGEEETGGQEEERKNDVAGEKGIDSPT